MTRAHATRTLSLQPSRPQWCSRRASAAQCTSAHARNVLKYAPRLRLPHSFGAETGYVGTSTWCSQSGEAELRPSSRVSVLRTPQIPSRTVPTSSFQLPVHTRLLQHHVFTCSRWLLVRPSNTVISHAVANNAFHSEDHANSLVQCSRSKQLCRSPHFSGTLMQKPISSRTYAYLSP